jgi:protein-tyrosine-phosphatase
MRRIVFVCVENSNRSQMAEAFARIHGGDQVEAFSAGSRPSGRVNSKAVEAMREVGYDLTAHHSKSLQDLAGVEFDVAVTMGCGDECPFIRAKRREDWNIPDPKALPPAEFRAIRDLIEGKVSALLAELNQSVRDSEL